MKTTEEKKSLQVILIDDEKNGLNALASLINKYVPQANVVAQCNSAKEGIEAIHKLNPEEKNLVFLDIEMPYQNGFEMLEEVKDTEFEVIFTTAFQQYAIKAFKYNAADYLLKPIDPSELKSAVERIEQRFALKEKGSVKKLLSNLHQSMHEENDRIALHTSEGIELISPMQIVRCEAQQSYTLFILADKSRILISKNIGEMETLLPANIFMRVHKSHIINVRFIRKYMRSDGGQLLMSDGELVDISRFRKEEILSRLNLRSL
ncbi:MAG: LytR/AlgR family response regulator transcription factor [Chitinophagales bacterium]